MGVRNLYKFLKTNYPHIFVKVHVSNYQFQKVTIDTMNYMYKIMATEAKYGRLRDEDWIKAMVLFALSFRKNLVHACFVFDGEAPHFKTKTREKRSEDRNKQKDSIDTRIRDLGVYRETGEISETLASFFKRENVSEVLGIIDTTTLDSTLQRRKDQLDISVTPEKIALLKEAFDIFDIPYIQAKGEGEVLCCQLVENGKANAVISEDSDCLIYRTSEILIDFDSQKFTATRVQYSDVLDVLEMNDEMFLDFCILCGIDYNDPIPRVGIAKSFDLIHHYKTIDDIPLDKECLNHNVMREYLLTLNEDLPVVSTFPNEPNWEKISEYTFKNHLRISFDLIEQFYTLPEITFDLS